MSGYSGEERKALKNWRPIHWSALRDIEYNVRTLRARAADLAMNSALGSAAIKTMTTGVVGSGLKLFPRLRREVLNLTAEEARRWSRRVKMEWALWAGKCDWLRRNTFEELQAVAYASSLVEGDAFVLFKRGSPDALTPYSLKLQLIEAGRVSNPTAGAIEERRSNRIINGIEIDDDGRLEAVWISNRQWDEPGDLVTWERVRWYGERTGLPNVLQIARDERPDQLRGVPLLAPALESLKQLSRYADAELTASIIRSFFSIFFTQPLSTLDINEVLGDVDVDSYRIGEPSVMALPRGVDVKSIGGQNAQSTYAAFTGMFIKQVGASIGIPYELLLKSFQNSYSASRAALQEAANEFRLRKAAFVNDFCRPVYEAFLTEAIALGRIDAPGFFDDPLKRAAYLNAEWFSEVTHFIEPLKEVQAAKARIDLGLTTYRKEAMELCGSDYDENKEEDHGTLRGDNAGDVATSLGDD